MQNKTGMATTGSGSRLPMSVLLKMAAHAYNYLLIFDEAKPLALYKGRSTG